MSQHENQENLLEGVLMTASISCHHQEEQGHFAIDGYQGRSFAADQEEFQLSSNQHQDQIALTELSANYTLSSDVQARKRTFINNSAHKINCMGKSLRKQWDHGQKKDKKWSALLDLDNRLVQINYSGILEDATNIVNKITQTILTEQFCSYKIYQKKILQILKDLQFSMEQFQRQKKSLINQIHLLKTDNQNLRDTIDNLSQIIKQLQQSFQHYYYFCEPKKQQQKEQKRIINMKQDIYEVPFTRHFIHSLDEMNFNQILQRQKKEIQYIKIDDFAQFIYEMKQKCDKIINPNKEIYPSKLYLSIIDRFSKHSIIRDWTVSVITSLYKMQIDKNSPLNYSQPYFQPTKSLFNTIERFLSIMCNKKHIFIKKINECQDKEMQFWFAIHSSLTTFLGILINQTKYSSLQISFSDNTKYWSNKFLQKINEIKEECNIKLGIDKLRYWQRIQSLVSNINELIIFRMLRNNI